MGATSQLPRTTRSLPTPVLWLWYGVVPTMTPAPRVSVICPFFNAQRYFREALESVLSQDFEHFELILIDDGSDDGSSWTAQEYARICSKVRYLEHPQHANRGTSASRNLGIRSARGQYIAFIDADDRWKPRKLGEQVSILDSMPDVDGLFGAVNYWARWNGGSDRVYFTGNIRNRKVRPPDAFLKWYPVGTAPAPSMSDLMLRRRAIAEIGDFEEAFSGPYEEHTFLAKFYLKRAAYVSDEVWSDYRQHNESCSAKLDEEGGYHHVRDRFFEWLEGYVARSENRDNLHILMAIHRAHLRDPRRLAARLRPLKVSSGA
jgi:glycosyltransferase involved in cell wall biosynthesis